MEPNYNPFENTPNGEEHTEQQDFHHTHQQPPRVISFNLFEAGAFVLAIGAILSCAFFYVAYIMGALAILFALLSRGGQMKLSSKAKMALLLSIAAIVLSTVLTISALYIAIEEFGSIENALREYCQMFGLDFEQEFGILFE